MNYKTCSTIWQRQGLDAGHGRIHVPSNYGKGGTDNDSCGDVYAPHDCPTGYKLLGGNSPSHDHGRVRTAGTAVSDHILKTKMCWRGGNVNGRGSQAPWGMSHGIHGRYYSKSNEGSGSNNYGKVCFKDNTGWKHTNPVNGNKTGNQEEDNKNACCGFKESVRDSVKMHYCNPSYCFNETMEYDNISKACADHLAKKCETWSFVEDSIGFEDDRCSPAVSQIANKLRKKVSELTDGQVEQKTDIPASLSDRDYARIGKSLCDKSAFLNKGSSNVEKAKKSDKCISWCKDNPDDCKDVIQDVCKDIYDRANNFPDNFPDDLKKYEDICACNWPQEFYDNIIQYYKDTYKVSDSSLSNDRKCLFRPCRSSNIPYTGDSLEDCENTTFVSCVQNLDIDFRGSNIEGTVNVEGSQAQTCGSLADTGASDNSGGSGGGDSGGEGDDSGGDTTNDSEEDSGESDNTGIFISIFVLSFLLILGAVGYKLSTK